MTKDWVRTTFYSIHYKTGLGFEMDSFFSFISCEPSYICERYWSRGIPHLIHIALILQTMLTGVQFTNHFLLKDTENLNVRDVMLFPRALVQLLKDCMLNTNKNCCLGIYLILCHLHGNGSSLLGLKVTHFLSVL